MANFQYNLFPDQLCGSERTCTFGESDTKLIAAVKQAKNGNVNKVRAEDASVHDWYRFVLSFPPHLVRDYLTKFGITSKHTVLDPFCGTGTTLVECKKLGIPSIGIEANPMAYFASHTKIDWSPSCKQLWTHAQRVAEKATNILENDGYLESLEFQSLRKRKNGLFTLDEEKTKLLLRNSISPLPLHRTLVLLDRLNRSRNLSFINHERLALAKSLVTGISNLTFGPEVGVGKPKHDVPVVSTWINSVRSIVEDLAVFSDNSVNSIVHNADSRDIVELLEPKSIDAVITSPPYPNEKDYTRTTRLESVILGLVRNKQDLRNLKQGLVRSNTRNVYKHDDDDVLVADNGEIQRIAREIEERRIALGKTSGFERLYARVAKLYFGGMKKHLSELRPALKPGAQLAYVVGDQASYLRILIRTANLLGEIADSLGYEVVRKDLFRTRLATATKTQLNEEVLILRWKG
jgi:DNA modification methylase